MLLGFGEALCHDEAGKYLLYGAHSRRFMAMVENPARGLAFLMQF
jgi:hypothetical protein